MPRRIRIRWRAGSGRDPTASGADTPPLIAFAALLLCPTRVPSRKGVLTFRRPKQGDPQKAPVAVLVRIAARYLAALPATRPTSVTLRVVDGVDRRHSPSARRAPTSAAYKLHGSETFPTPLDPFTRRPPRSDRIGSSSVRPQQFAAEVPNHLPVWAWEMFLGGNVQS
jgi:hypothetical protein